MGTKRYFCKQKCRKIYRRVHRAVSSRFIRSGEMATSRGYVLRCGSCQTGNQRTDEPLE
ncbi:MAG: hypothetical protein ACLSVO_05070 [Alistipes sp.]|uniref:hypothetical protein n=1 Tax=Alistipes sp. TaxID=1872444 RepID=UPI003993B076